MNKMIYFWTVTFGMWISPLLGVSAQGPATTASGTNLEISFFHENIRDSKGECYLVCTYEATVEKHGILDKEGMWELRIKAVVIDSLQGSRKRGDKIEYIQYGGAKEVTDKRASELRGALQYIFYRQTPQGHFFDPQDPRSATNYSDANQKILRDFFGKK